VKLTKKLLRKGLPRKRDKSLKKRERMASSGRSRLKLTRRTSRKLLLRKLLRQSFPTTLRMRPSRRPPNLPRKRPQLPLNNSNNPPTWACPLASPLE